MVKSLLDPNKGPARGAPKDERDLMIAAANSHLVVFDDISRLNPDIADSLCRLATGDGFSTRQLYTDDEETVFEAVRPIILNRIEALAVRGDLADPAVVLSLPMLERKKSESEFKAEFEAARNDCRTAAPYESLGSSTGAMISSHWRGNAKSLFAGRFLLGSPASVVSHK